MNVQMEYNIKNKELTIEKVTDNLKVKEYIKFSYIFGSFAQIVKTQYMKNIIMTLILLYFLK